MRLQASIRSLLPRLHYFDEGTCIVHHMFGAETTSLVRKAYSDALLTAHFEVPVSLLIISLLTIYVVCNILYYL